MAGSIKRTNPGDAANIFVRCILSDVSDMLGGFHENDLEKTVAFFDYKCPYTGEDIAEVFKNKQWVLDHLIPHNREACGLNLYGNIIVTTRKVNSAKAAKSFEDFIRSYTKGNSIEKEARIKKLKDFQKQSGYLEKTKNLDKLKEFCQSEYDRILQALSQDKTKYPDIMGISGFAQKTNSQKRLSEQSAKASNQIKVGKIAQNRLRPLLESGKVSTDEIEKLKDAGYCKIVFGLYVPMLIPYCGQTVYRYYSPPVSIHGKLYLLTNDWYEDENRHNREPLLQWIAKYEDNKQTDLQG